MQNIIEIDSLNKHYGSVHAVRDLSFRVKTGELFAFLGVNGAGKSTTINIICGIVEKDGGSVRIDGADTEKDSAVIKRELGVVFQSSLLDASLSVKDNLECRAALYGITGAEFEKRLEELTKLFDLGDFLKRPVGKLSGGQRRRADIARALVHRPRILILDEPTTGLDPQTRKQVWSVIAGLRRTENMTVFLTTHYMEEAADADYVVIIDGGTIAAEGAPIELKNKYTADYITLYGADKAAVDRLGIGYETVGGAYRLSVKNTAEATALIIKHPDVFTDYEIIKGRMDDVFLAVTGKTLTGGDEK